MKRKLLFPLLFVSQIVLAEASFPIGPWRIGDTREQVISQAEFGPYASVPVTGGLETTKAKFQGQTTTVSFVFNAADRLRYLQVWAY
jgi:hypothetical protein